jgi:RNA polymerase primary sigma factor
VTAICGPGHARLSGQHERELVRAAQLGQCDARDELIEAFMPLIGAVARIYRGSRTVDRLELMQEGVVGLLRALHRYDADLGTPFWAYASWWVRQAMQQLVSELTRPVVLSDRAARQLARVRDARREHVQALGREPSLTELADEADLPRKQVENLVIAERSPRAFDEPITGDEGVVGTFGDLLADQRAEDAFDGVPLGLEVERTLELVDRLSERERTVVQRRFGLGVPQQTLREIGDRLGVSAERVRQIEERALRRLRDAIDGDPPGREVPVGAVAARETG